MTNVVEVLPEPIVEDEVPEWMLEEWLWNRPSAEMLRYLELDLPHRQARPLARSWEWPGLRRRARVESPARPERPSGGPHGSAGDRDLDGPRGRDHRVAEARAGLPPQPLDRPGDAHRGEDGAVERRARRR